MEAMRYLCVTSKSNFVCFQFMKISSIRMYRAIAPEPQRLHTVFPPILIKTNIFLSSEELDSPYFAEDFILVSF